MEQNADELEDTCPCVVVQGRSGDAWPKGLDAGARRREADRVAHRDPHITPYHAGSLSSERGVGL